MAEVTSQDFQKLLAEQVRTNELLTQSNKDPHSTKSPIKSLEPQHFLINQRSEHSIILIIIDLLVLMQ